MKLVHVIPSLGYGSAENQLRCLAQHLPSSIQQHVIALRGQVPPSWCDLPPVTLLNLPHRLEVSGLPRLRRVITQIAPSVVHAWRVEACGWVAASTRMLPVERIASFWQPPTNNWVMQTLWRRGMSTCLTPPWMESHESFGDSGLETVGFALPQQRSEDRTQQRALLTNHLGIPSDSWLVGCVGPWSKSSRLKDAVWAADLLKVIRDDVHVIIAGYGPMRGRLETFRRQVDIQDRVHFVSTEALIRATLDGVDVHWVTHQAWGGVSSLLEAMARSLPVIATDLPCHRRYLDDGVNGRIVSVGHRAGFARTTTQLLDQPDVAKRLAVAGHKDAMRHGELEPILASYIRLYENLAKLKLSLPC